MAPKASDAALSMVQQSHRIFSAPSFVFNCNPSLLTQQKYVYVYNTCPKKPLVFLNPLDTTCNESFTFTTNHSPEFYQCLSMIYLQQMWSPMTTVQDFFHVSHLFHQDDFSPLFFQFPVMYWTVLNPILVPPAVVDLLFCSLLFFSVLFSCQ